MPLANATWLQVLEDWQASDTTISRYARQHNLKAHQLRYWKKQLLDQPVAVSALIPMGNLQRLSRQIRSSDRYRMEIPANNAILYSLVETAKANGLEPWRYLTDILTALPTADSVEKLEALRPWNAVGVC